MARLEGIHKALETHSVCRLRALELELRKELENILFQEEVYWRQKSTSDFANLGDRSTKYYHVKTKSKIKRSRIEMLRIGDDWCCDEDVFKREAL